MRRIASAKDLGATIRGRRLERRLSQDRVAEAAGVSRQWLSAVEAGKATAEVGLVLRVLDALRLDLVPVAREHGADREGPAPLDVVDLDEVLEEYRTR